MALLETVSETTAERIRALQRDGRIAAGLDSEALAEGLVLMSERSFQVNLGDGDLGAEAAAAAVTKVWWAALFEEPDTASGEEAAAAEPEAGLAPEVEGAERPEEDPEP